MTVDEIFAPSNAGNAYSIQDVLAAIGSQYQPRQTGSIDEILSQMSLGYEPIQAKVMPTGAGQYITGQPVSEAYTPSEFDFDALKMEYESAADKAQRTYNETYASEIAAGKSEYEAQKKAAEDAKFWGTAGAIAGSFLPIPGGSVIGSLVGSKLGNQLDSLTTGFDKTVRDFLDW